MIRKTGVFVAVSFGGNMRHLIFASLATTLVNSGALAADSPQPSLSEIVVVGSREALQAISGSGAVITTEDLERAQVFTVNEALRQVPGVFPRDEEGFGLRPNIGIRGLSPTRSTKVLLLEDGLPLSYAPYGDNASYYHPPVERFERIEVLKGASQIRFGPATIGGVINYITPNAPEEAQGRLSLSAGNRGYLELDGMAGGPALGGNWLLHVNRKESDGSRDNLDLSFTDIYLKGDYRFGDNQSLTIRLSRFSENSQITYSGLTQAEYLADPRQNPFKNDKFETRRWSGSLLYGWQLSDSATLRTAAYIHYFDRDWWRQSSNSQQRPNDSSDPACGGMANLNTTCGNEGRLREYYTYGVESRLTLEHGTQLTTEVGLRAHKEEQRRQQVNSDSPTGRTAGTGVNAGLRENNDRFVTAYSGFIQSTLTLGVVTVTPGVRIEEIRFRRVNKPLNATQAETRGKTSLTEVIPGIGLNWAASDTIAVYAGVHRGFAPPAVSDIISGGGGTVELSAEKSWNYELGLRGDVMPGLSIDTSLFLMDFSNQIVPASVAGGVGATLTSAGKTRHRGAELALNWSAQGAGLMTDNDLYARTAITWVEDASYRGTRRATPPCLPGNVVGTPIATGSGPRPCGISADISGNRLPYAPEWLVSATLGYAWGKTASVQAEIQHQSGMFADDVNLIPATPDGQRGRIGGWTTVNLATTIALPGTMWSIKGSVKNLFDTLYIADRSRGILPGTPRLFQLGVSAQF
jgi:Fe(3+) dicitrate transport protein